MRETLARVSGSPARAVQSDRNGLPEIKGTIMSLLNIVKNGKAADPLYSVAETPGRRRAASLLDALLRRASADGPFTEIVDVTPELAEMLLDRNADNRFVSNHLVEAISRDITEGRWVCNGETVIVSDGGELNDGQHRCRAVVKAGRTIRTFMTFGVPRASRMTVDGQQKTRLPGDYLAMDGIANAHQVAAVAGYLWQIERFGSIPEHAHTSVYRPTKQQVGEMALRHREEISEALRVVPRKGSQKVASFGVLAVAYLLLSRATGDRDQVREYIARIVDGANLDTKNPIYVVRERLLKDKSQRKFRPHNGVELLLRGWNAHRRGRSIDKAQLGQGWPKIAR